MKVTEKSIQAFDNKIAFYTLLLVLFIIAFYYDICNGINMFMSSHGINFYQRYEYLLFFRTRTEKL